MSKSTHPRRRLLRSAFGTTIWTTVAVSAIAGLSGVIATRALGPYERGLLAAAVAWSLVLGSISAYGAPNAATYFVARDRDRPPRAASTVLALAVMVGFAASCLGLIATLLLVYGAAGPPLAIAFAGIFPGVVAGAGIGAVLGLGEYRNWGLVRILGPAATLVGVCIVIALGWRTAVAVATVTVLSTAIQLGVLITMLRRRDQIHAPARRMVGSIVSYAWRNIVTGAGWLISTHLDQLVLSIAVAPQLLGVYAVAASFSAIILSISSAPGSVMLRRAAAGGAEAVPHSLPRALGASVLVAGSAGVVVFLAAPVLVEFLFGPAFRGSVTPLRILLVGTIPLTISAVISDTLRGLGRPLVPARGELIGAGSTLMLLPVAIPAFGINGAALVSTFSYTLSMVAMAHYLRKELRGQRG